MRGAAKKASMAAGLLLIFFCYLGAAERAGQIRVDPETGILINSGNPEKREEALELLEQETKEESPISLCFWGEQEGIFMENKELGRRERAEALYVCGNIQLLFPGGAGLDWKDTKSCLIGEGLAEALFGTKAAQGGKLVCQEQEYEIKGVIKDLDMAAVLPSPKDQVLLSRVSYNGGRAYEKEEAQTMLENRYGLEGEALELGYLKAWAMGLLYLLPICGVLQLLLFLKRCFREEKGAGKWFFLGAMGILLGALWIFLRGNVEIPRDMLPSKWSDFTFWENWWEKTKDAILVLIQSEKTEAELTVFLPFFQSILCSVLSLWLYFLWNICYTIGKKKSDRFGDGGEYEKTNSSFAGRSLIGFRRMRKNGKRFPEYTKGNGGH